MPFIYKCCPCVYFIYIYVPVYNPYTICIYFIHDSCQFGRLGRGNAQPVVYPRWDIYNGLWYACHFGRLCMFYV